MHRIKSTAVVLLVLSLVLVTIPQNAVKAQDTIYIRANGTVEGTDKIEQKGYMYTFTDNVYVSVVVERDNIKIYGLGHAILGPQTDYAQSTEEIGILVEGRNNVSIHDLTVQNFLYGILINDSFNIRLADSKITENSKGIVIEHSSDSFIQRNQITNNDDVGVFVFESFNTLIGQNIIADNEFDGVNIFGSIDFNDNGFTNIDSCEIRGNQVGIRIFNSLNSSIRPIFANNNISNNRIGIYLEASYVAIDFNNLTNNEVGIQIAGSENDIDHNNFNNNIKQVYDNAWDDVGIVPSVNNWYEGDTGNYWSDYNRTGETLYIIDENNKDLFPATHPFRVPNEPWDPGTDVFPMPIIYYGIILIISIIVAVVFFIWVRKSKKSKLQNIH